MTPSTVPSTPQPVALENALAALDHGATLLEEACRELWSAHSSRRSGAELAMANALRDLRHEVRNPLGGMRGLTGLLARELEVRPSTSNATRLLDALRQRVDATSEALERGAAAADDHREESACDASNAAVPPPPPLRALLWNLVRNAAEIGALGRSAALGASGAGVATPPAAPPVQIGAAPPVAASSPAPASPADDIPAPSDTDPVVALLRERGVSDPLARALGREARERSPRPEDLTENLRSAIAAALSPSPALELLGRCSVVVIGPSGSGKTTTLAKIAADAVARGEEPVLVCADGESLTGEDALAAVGTALSLPIESAFVEGHLETVIARRGAHRAYLVDTAGRSPEDPGAVAGLQALVRAIEEPVVLLVVAASTEAGELHRLVQGFAPLRIDGLVVTRLDEAARPGRLVSIAQSIALPIAWVTFGRSARGAAAPPNDPRVVARVLGTTLAAESVA
jgi:flagellar biosynthesis protein FlhF